MGKLSDILVGCGLCLVTAGLGWIYPPAALLFAGAALCAVGFLVK